MSHYRKKWIVDLLLGVFLLSCGQGVQPPVPTVTSISPAEGTSLGGTAVTLTGGNFTSDTKIDIGGNPCTDVTVNSSSSITCTVPPHTPAFADITASEFHVSSVFSSAYNFLVSGWRFIDGGETNGINKDSTKTGTNVFLADFNSKLYSTWSETNGTATQVRVAVYNESLATWSFVDGNTSVGLNKNASLDAGQPNLFTFNSKLYLSWAEGNGTASQVRVAVYNGNDMSPSWSFVDGGGNSGINRDASFDAVSPRLSSFRSALYITWVETNASNDQIRVAVYNGDDSSPAWSFADGAGSNGLNKNPAKAAGSPNLAVYNDRLYLAWREVGFANRNQLRVAVFNGSTSSPSWTFLDGGTTVGLNKKPAVGADYPRFALSNSNLYIAWVEGGGGTSSVRVALYNGNDSSPSWTFIDGNGTTGLRAVGGAVVSLSAVVFNSKIHIVWDEINTNVGLLRSIHSMRYNADDNSPSWTLIDGEGRISMSRSELYDALFPSLAVSNGNLYSGWHESSSSSQIRAVLAY